MDAIRLIDSLERFPSRLAAVVLGIEHGDARWKPPDGAWSITEVVAHLLDEERDDFRTRLELTLRDPAIDWPPIAPEQWAVERRYNERDLAQTLAEFTGERRKSIAQVRSLQSPDWTRSRPHRLAGTIRAGDLLLSWAVHDLLHLRQITKRLVQIAERDGDGYRSRYAGEW
jgi:hypothetical protein